MKNFIRTFFVIGAMLTATAASADTDNGRLFIIGDGTTYGWSLDDAQALLATTQSPTVFTGTIYLNGGESNLFKFMEAHEWGSTEYGIAESAAVSGDITLLSGKNDSGYAKMYVAEAGNYDISIDTENLKGSITRSAYQDTEISYTSLFLVGDNTGANWSVESGVPLYQSTSVPYEYSTTTDLTASGSFKIVKALKGACSWGTKYFYFKDADDAGKITDYVDADNQWTVTSDGQYVITVNTVAMTISIAATSGIEDIIGTADADCAPVYYNLQGVKVTAPSNGVFIKVSGQKVEKVIR